MFNKLGPTHPKATDEPVDDVEGHRVAMFIEDQKDTVLGPLPTVGDNAPAEQAGDVDAHIRVGLIPDDTQSDDVDGHRWPPR